MRSNPLTRRSFLGTAVAAAAGFTLPRLASAAAKPNSVFNGVHIGCITYSYRSMAKTAQETLQALLDDGLSETELMGGPIQDFAGIKGKATDAEREQQLAKCRELRKMYNDAGVNIHIHKMGFGQSNEEIEFSFLVAKALGCTGVTTERNAILAARVEPFADKHKIWVGFHNHTNNLPEMDQQDAILDLGQYIGFNLDIGLKITDHGLDQAVIDDLIQKAHQVCPYSNAIKGNVHVVTNQTNENGKHFACFFPIPELNHHLMEGLKNPAANKNLKFFLITSNLYHPRNQKRYKILKTVLAKNKIDFAEYQPKAKTKLLQAFEVLNFGSYLSFYLAMSYNLDPTPVPLVDFFKKHLH